MMKRTHMLFGVGFTLYLMTRLGLFDNSIVLFSIVFSIFPDLDIRRLHRKLFHNVFTLTLVPLIVVMVIDPLLIGNTISAVPEWAAYMASITAYSTHIFLDALTYTGVYFFWPLLDRPYGIRRTSFDSRIYNFVFSVFGILLIVLSFI